MSKCHKRFNYTIKMEKLWVPMILRVPMFKGSDSQNKQKKNCCSFQQIVQHNMSYFLS